MTIKKDLYIYRVLYGTKRIKKISLNKLLNHLNLEVFTKRFFVNKEDAIKFMLAQHGGSLHQNEQENRKEKKHRKP